MNVYPLLNMDSHRKRRLQQFIDERLGGSRAQFMLLTNYSKGRLTQLLPGSDEPFGERAARNIASKLMFVDDRWFEKDTSVAEAFGHKRDDEPYRPVSDLPVSTHRLREYQPSYGKLHRVPKLNVAGSQGGGATLPSTEYQSATVDITDDWALFTAR